MRAEGLPGVILPKDRDPRFVTIRRGGSVADTDHQLLALWAASCAEHVLDRFESARPEDLRPRQAIEQARAWVRGEVTMSEARAAGGHAMAAARDLSGAARHAAYAAGQAAVVGTLPRTNSVPQLTRSKPSKLRPLKMNASRPAKRSAAGSANSSPMKFANLCLMINDDAMTCAGLYLSVNQPAERITPLLRSLTCGDLLIKDFTPSGHSS